MRSVHMALHEAMDVAVREHLILKNPTNGTTIPKCNYPPKQILQAFHNKVVVIFDSIKNNINEINALTKQRDELLPLLMNGQITIE